MEFVLDELPVCVLLDRTSPESLSGKVQRHLSDFPFSRKVVEDELGSSSAKARSAIALHDKELTQPVGVLREGHVRIDKPESSVLVVHKEQEGTQTRIAEVTIDGETVLAVHVDILR